MVPGNVHHIRAVTGEFQKQAHHLIVYLSQNQLRQAPAIDDVAHQEQVLAGKGVQEVGEEIARQPRVPRCVSEMKTLRDVGVMVRGGSRFGRPQ